MVPVDQNDVFKDARGHRVLNWGRGGCREKDEEGWGRDENDAKVHIEPYPVEGLSTERRGRRQCLAYL